MSRFVALLDACVLVPVSLADTLLRVAEVELYRPVWSNRILDEVRSAILEIHPDEDSGRVDARLRSMNEAFDILKSLDRAAVPKFAQAVGACF